MDLGEGRPTGGLKRPDLGAHLSSGLVALKIPELVLSSGVWGTGAQRRRRTGTMGQRSGTTSSCAKSSKRRLGKEFHVTVCISLSSYSQAVVVDVERNSVFGKPFPRHGLDADRPWTILGRLFPSPEPGATQRSFDQQPTSHYPCPQLVLIPSDQERIGYTRSPVVREPLSVASICAKIRRVGRPLFQPHTLVRDLADRTTGD